MKRFVIPLLVVLLALSIVATAFTALEKEMSIQVDKTQLRATPAYYGSLLETPY